eukprot:GHVS01094675.1.p1 GENE.GHVS01094675.1~~GHVS01094675.1.p1  ORF type:complete len:341 (+),score=63.70 GHVS01094675.1:337-1359(+)
MFNQRMLPTKNGAATLKELGISSDAMLVVVPAPMAPPPPPPTQNANRSLFDFSDVVVDPSTREVRVSPPPSPPTAPQQGGELGAEASSLLSLCAADPSTLTHLIVNNPMLAEALSEKDPVKVAQVMGEQINRRKKEQEEHFRRMAAVTSDPLSLESQRILEDQVNQHNVDEQLNFAQEHLPESFGHVIMLYVTIHVNGIPVKAFVDSGAQTTIMSSRFAEKCNLLRLVDKRFKGVAHGVGISNIIGRIHTVHIKIGPSFFPASITILEDDKIDFLFGLDMLRRHQMCIDLKKNVLSVGDMEVPFLSEKDLKDVKGVRTCGDDPTPTNRGTNNSTDSSGTS